jgi:hypothetical protein
MVEVNVGDTGDQTTVVSSVRSTTGTTTTSSSTYNSTPSTTTTSSTSYGTTTSTDANATNNQYANTASPIWAYALVGLFGLAGALAFRRWRVAQG